MMQDRKNDVPMLRGLQSESVSFSTLHLTQSCKRRIQFDWKSDTSPDAIIIDLNLRSIAEMHLHLRDLNSTQTIVREIFRMFSKFLTKMVEANMLETYTFLYTENYSCVEGDYTSVVSAIEDFKDLLLKLCSDIPAPNKTICDTSGYDILPQNPMNDCLAASNQPTYTSHTEHAYSSHTNGNFDLYADNSLHDSLEQNIQFMSTSNDLCGSLSQTITDTATGMCPALTENIDFTSADLSTDPMKENEPSMDYNGYDINQSRSDVMMNVSGAPYDMNYTKNDTDSTHHGNCNDSLFNTLKEAISGDFLQNMKFPAVDDRPLERNMSFSEQVPYPPCASALQHIDLDILSNSNERLSNALDRILDDQFAENDGLLESECWNVDINLPSAEPMQSNMDLESNEFELPACANNMKEKNIEVELSRSLSNFEASPDENLERSLEAMNTTLNNSISSTLDELERSKYDDFEGDKYFCEHCGFICNTKLKLKIHLKRQHNVYTKNVHKCEECGKEFKSRRTLLTHTIVHRDIKPFKCPYCWKSFSQKITLDSHIQMHNGLYKFPCPSCQKRFPTRAKLNFHAKSHEKPELSCDICSKMFTTRQYLNMHRKSHNKAARPVDKRFSCMKCSLLFEKNTELSMHIREAHPDVTFVCYYVGCNRSYKTYKQLKDHIYKRHTSSKSMNKRPSNKFECEICHTQFVEKSSYHRHNLLVHRKEVDAENSFNCMHCDKRFTTESGLDDHLEKFHNVTLTEDVDYSCVICGSMFYEEAALKNHMSIHSDFGTHVCQTCDSIFTQKADYLVHQSVHDLKKQNVLKKFKCETCETRFESKMELRQHELDAHNIVPSLEELKPHACLYCEKRFTTRGKCNLHMDTHSDNRKYQCTVCSKSFFRRDVLKEHMNTHTGYRAHVCKVCGMGFTQSASLKTHEASHDRKETFACNQCDKVFQSKQALNYHIKIHEGNFRFACDVCGKKFVRKCHYEIHVRSHSNERPFKCVKCSTAYKTSKHLRDHNRKAHPEKSNLNNLLDSIYTEDEVISQPSLLDEYIPAIDPLHSDLIFPKT